MRSSLLVRKLENQENSIEAQLVVAATQISDRESLHNFNSLLQRATDIDAKGAIFSKAALNLAVEALFNTFILSNPQILSDSIIFFKLTAIDQLLARKADINVLRHVSTHRIMEAVKLKFASILSTIASSGTPLISFSANDRAFMVAYHWYMKSMRATVKARLLRLSCETTILTSPPSSKPIIICEDSTEPASYLLLSGLKDRLFAAGYKTLGLDHEHNLKAAALLELFEKIKCGGGIFEYNATIKAQHMKLKFALEQGFELAMLDPSDNWHAKNTSMLLEMYTANILGEKLSIAVRDQGIFYASLQATYKNDGKVVIIVDVAHAANLIANLQQQGIESVAVAPFVDPKKLNLKSDETGNFSCQSTENDRIYKLFNQYNCKPLDLSNPDKVEELITEFWQGSFAAPVAAVDATSSTVSEYKKLELNIS